MAQYQELTQLSAASLAALYRSGDLSPVDVARASLDCIKDLNGVVNAYCLIDEDTTLAAARRSEERFRRLSPLGPIDGVPVAIKDIFYWRGWPNLKGSTIVDPNQPWDSDAPACAALRRNGCVPNGRTTTPEFGWKGITDSTLWGITRNPFDPDKTSGGSSGGSAAALPLGMTPLALGTDAGGSIRIPAGFCGCVGLKPTHGLAPMWPPSAFYPLAHVGPMTRTVEDTVLLLAVLAEPDARDTTVAPVRIDPDRALQAGVRGMRIAYSPDLGYVDVHPEIRASLDQAVAVMEELGARVEVRDPGFSDPLEAFDILFYGGAANALRDLTEDQLSRMDPALTRVAAKAAEHSLLDYLGAMGVRAELMERMNLFHEQVDLLITPTLPIPAFTAGMEVPEGWPHERWPTWTPFTYPFNLTGQPAISVPCGFTSAGLPIGMQIIGGRHRDNDVLRAAHTYQLARPLLDRLPPILESRQ